jgi:hypothetical protein
MAKGPFETPLERAMREVLGSQRVFEEYFKQQRMLRNIVEPGSRLPPEVLATRRVYDEQFKKAVANLNRRSLFPVLDARIGEIARAAPGIAKAIDLGFGGGFDAYRRAIAELAGPLKTIARDLERQQQGFAETLLTSNLSRWADFSEIAKSLSEHYRSQAEYDPEFMAMAAALDEVEPDKPDPRVVDILLGALVAMLLQLAKNTRKRLADLDILEILLILAAIKGLVPDYSATDRERDNKTAATVQHIEDKVKEVAAARTAELAYVNALPRAIVAGAGRVREAPTVSAKIRDKLARGTPIAIAERRGRWRHVVFHDVLTDELARGWIWAGSIEELERK